MSFLNPTTISSAIVVLLSCLRQSKRCSGTPETIRLKIRTISRGSRGGVPVPWQSAERFALQRAERRVEPELLLGGEPPAQERGAVALERRGHVVGIEAAHEGDDRGIAAADGGGGARHEARRDAEVDLPAEQAVPCDGLAGEDREAAIHAQDALVVTVDRDRIGEIDGPVLVYDLQQVQNVIRPVRVIFESSDDHFRHGRPPNLACAISARTRERGVWRPWRTSRAPTRTK